MKNLIVFSIFFYKILAILSQECVFCKPRNFSEEVLPKIRIFDQCFCPESHFCNTSTNKCNNCGNCFQFWQNRVNTTKDNTAAALNKVIKILNQIQEHIKAITKKFNRQKNEIRNLEKSIANVTNSIPKVTNATNYLEKEATEIGKKLQQIKLPNDSEKDLLEYFENLGEEIDKMAKNLEDFKEDFLDNDSLTNLSLELNNINKNIQNYNDQFPKISSYQNLNLVEITENDINLLEKIIAKNIPSSSNSTFPENISTSMTFIEKSLLNLFELLNNLFKLPIDMSEIDNDASEAKKIAEKLKTKTENLLKKEQIFEDLLLKIDKELEVYRNVKMLKERFENIKKLISSLSFLNDSSRFEKLNKAFQKYNKQVKKYKNKIKNIETKEEKLEKLLNEKKLLVDRARNISASSLDDLDEKLEKVAKIINELETHCNSTLLQ